MTHDEQNNSSDAGTKVPMTHDELLAKIDETDKWINSTPLSLEFQTRLINQNKALRAVVELHKPVFNGVNTLCYCGAEGFYPCPTIQVITKELN